MNYLKYMLVFIITILFFLNISFSQQYIFSPDVDTLCMGGGCTPIIIYCTLINNPLIDSIRITPGWNTYFWDKSNPASGYFDEVFFIIKDTSDNNNYQLWIDYEHNEYSHDGDPVKVPFDSDFAFDATYFYLKLYTFRQDSLIDSLLQFCLGYVGLPVEEIDNNPLPIKTELKEIYPNPFNSITIIKYNLSKSGFTELKVFSTDGKLISTLYSNYQEAGQKKIIWDASNQSSGAYFIVLKTNNEVHINKCIHIK